MKWVNEIKNNLIHANRGKAPSSMRKYPYTQGQDSALNFIFENLVNENGNFIKGFAVDIGAGCGWGGCNVRHIVDKYKLNSCELDSFKHLEHKGRRQRYRKEATESKVQDFIATKDNICDKLENDKVHKRYDLLSVDIDSLDWYVVESMLSGGYIPSVAIIEYNPIFLYNESYVVKYNEDRGKDRTSRYGASLKAYENLFKKHNLSLVFVFPRGKKTGENDAIFIHNDYLDLKYVKDIKELQHDRWICKGKHKSYAWIKKHKLEGIEGLVNSYIEREEFICKE
jgi:hypothetical protein